jgi:hypothetical protein
MPAAVFSTPSPLELAAAKMHDPRFTFLDFQNDLCDETLCHAVVGGIPAYIDSDHLSAPFVRTFASAFSAVRALAPQ